MMGLYCVECRFVTRTRRKYYVYGVHHYTYPRVGHPLHKYVYITAIDELDALKLFKEDMTRKGLKEVEPRGGKLPKWLR